MNYFRIVSLLAVALISACSNIERTPDNRTAEEKLLDVQAVSRRLEGVYKVESSRADEIDANTIQVTAKNGGFDVLVKGTKSPGFLLFRGLNCGSPARTSSMIYVGCTSSSGISTFSMQIYSYDYQIKSGAMLGGFAPMQVKAGDIVFEYTEGRVGRMHYYRLIK